VISSSQRPLPDNNTQHSQQTDIHAPGGIRTHNPSRRATVDPRLRPRGHWDRLITLKNKEIKVSGLILFISQFRPEFSFSNLCFQVPTLLDNYNLHSTGVIFVSSSPKYKKQSLCRLEGFQEVETPKLRDNRQMKAVKLPHLQTYSPATFTSQEMLLVLISVRGRVL